MGLTRRAVLQYAGIPLAALGLRETGLARLADRYQRALAQPTRRKLALLVGINQYPEQVCDCSLVRGSALQGCVTDVELQRELLIHRFGFHPSDVLALIDEQATRSQIEAAFLHHLIEQAQSDDVVMFHFSGLGSRVRLGLATESNSLVPIDGVLPTTEETAIQDLLEDTLGLLLRSLPTQQTTTVLDLSYSNSIESLPGLRVRSRPSTPSGQPNPAELAFQAQLSQLNPSNQIRNGSEPLPGVVLRATDTHQGAIEGQWSGFSAGLLTYALTQQLWQTTAATPLHVVLSRTTTTLNQWVGIDQQLRLSGRQDLPYNTTLTASPADGVIRAIEDDGQTLHIWMGGLPSLVLEHYGAGSIVAVLPAPSSPGFNSPPSEVLLQVRSREGLLIKAHPCCSEGLITADVGQLVQEKVRVLPHAVGLTIALDDRLERIERVDATSALATVARVATVAAGESADYVFGKTELSKSSMDAQAIATSFPPPMTDQDSGTFSTMRDSYGLFNVGRSLIPGTVIDASEAVKTAINRLTPKLQTLLANKLLRLTNNCGSSQVGVRTTLERVAPQERIVLQQETIRSSMKVGKREAGLASEGLLPTVPIGSRVCYRLQNWSDCPLYFVVFSLDNGNAIALHPGTASLPNSVRGGAILPGETLVLPQRQSSGWLINSPPGLVETHLIFSNAPFEETLVALNSAVPSGDELYNFRSVSNPLEVAQAVLHDLHQASMLDGLPAVNPAFEGYRLSVNAWATLNFVYRTTES